MALNTGLRSGELTSLRWKDIDLRFSLLTVRADEAKSGKARHILLNDEAQRVFRDWQPDEAPSSALVFPGGEAQSPLVDIKTCWKPLLLTAQITQFLFHDLRHTFASKLVMAGVDLNTVRELLGHAGIKMTLRYAHLAPEHKAAAVAKLFAPR